MLQRCREGDFVSFLHSARFGTTEPSAQISPPIVGRGKSGLETAPVVWARPYLCVLFQNGPRQKNKHRPTRIGECSLFWCILGVAGFLPCEQKGGKPQPMFCFSSGQKGVCVFLPHGQRSFYARVKTSLRKRWHQTFPQSIGCFLVFLHVGVRANFPCSSCCLIFCTPSPHTAFTMVSALMTHLYFLNAVGPPSHNYCCFSTTGCTPQWCENLFFFFSLVLVDILVNENHPQLASLVWQFWTLGIHRVEPRYLWESETIEISAFGCGYKVRWYQANIKCQESSERRGGKRCFIQDVYVFLRRMFANHCPYLHVAGIPRVLHRLDAADVGDAPVEERAGLANEHTQSQRRPVRLCMREREREGRRVKEG